MRTPLGASPQRRLLARTDLNLWLLDAWKEIEQPPALAALPVPDVPMMNMGVHEAEEEFMALRQLQAHDGATEVEKAAGNALDITEPEHCHENGLAAWDVSPVQGGANPTSSPLDIQEQGILTIKIDADVFVWNYGYPGDLTLLTGGLQAHNETMPPDKRDVNIGLTDAKSAPATNGRQKEASHESRTLSANESESPLSSAALYLQPDLAPIVAGVGWGISVALPNLTGFTTPEVPFPSLEGDDQVEPEYVEGRESQDANIYLPLERSTVAGERHIVNDLMTYGGAWPERPQADRETGTGKGRNELTGDQIREVVEQVLLDIYESMEPL